MSESMFESSFVFLFLARGFNYQLRSINSVSDKIKYFSLHGKTGSRKCGVMNLSP